MSDSDDTLIAAGCTISLHGGAYIVEFPDIWTVEDALEQIELMAERVEEIKAGLAALKPATEINTDTP